MDSKNADKVSSLILRLSQELGWVLFRHRNKDKLLSFIFYNPNDSMNDILWIDIYHPVNFRGMPLIPEEFFLNNRVSFDNFFIPAPGCEAALTLSKELLGEGGVKLRDREKVYAKAKDDPERFLSVLSFSFGKKQANKLLELIYSREWETFGELRGSLALKLIINSLKRNPVTQVVSWLRYLKDVFYERMLSPMGFFLVLIGPDGVGKSSVSERLLSDARETFDGCKIYHFRPSILPELRTLWSWVKERFSLKRRSVDTKEMKIHDKNFSAAKSKLFWFIRILYYTIDFMLGYLPIRYEKGKGKLVIFDRYYYEYFIQQSNSRMYKLMLFILSRFVPKPDAVVYLTDSPVNIYKRKQELSQEEIQRQSHLYEEIINRLPNGRKVLVDSGLDTTVERVKKVICEKMAKNLRK